jgi:O-methyltransferase
MIKLTKIMRALLKFQRNSRQPETLVPQEYISLLLELTSKAISVPGDIVEVGVYKGGTLFRLAQHIHKNHFNDFLHRRLIGIDTFAGHPYINEDKDPPHHYKGRFNDTSYETVCSYFSSYNFVNIFQGECSSIFNNLPKDQQFCLANIDVDIYESYVRSIEYVYPRISPGGIIICDEYEGYGQKMFIDEYFKDKPVQIKPRVGLNKNKGYGIIIYKNP